MPLFIAGGQSVNDHTRHTTTRPVRARRCARPWRCSQRSPPPRARPPLTPPRARPPPGAGAAASATWNQRRCECLRPASASHPSVAPATARHSPQCMMQSLRQQAHCETCSSCSSCSCGLPTAGAVDCKRACAQPPPFKPSPGPFPALPTATTGQRAAAKRASDIATAASPAARPAVLAMLSDPSIKIFLQKLGGTLENDEPLHNLSASELLHRGHFYI